ncbi:LON peptidase substrate-binding domain-containing protein [Dactylosporangium sp. AC04546]|uniref:LON peptidase substrate-binding domain-containing protein n=1 Tax=Dactylosporangium sp. AC04546 TaxID=2862460 RepID=UPI001EDF7F28|nr:LON peptidase substrate-binding domain-containing protein [Dactylosporangium sp. AC04546]WVK82099.1 LON peptidase substrate-binding domain-containing protein [Dactylosporangium sp. AC04546]
MEAANEPERDARTLLPLFPLGTVLFPGLVLPLHVFEPRYRTLVQHLTDLPASLPREFGVVAIRRGWEVGRQTEAADASITAGESLSLYEIGCAAEVRQITELPDGRFDLMTVGRRRFRLLGLARNDAPYLTGEIEWLPEPQGEPDREGELAAGVLAAFQQYLRAVRRNDAEGEDGEQLPDDPTVLSHLVAATASLTLEDRQSLLAEPDTASRLKAERSLLRREAALLGRVRAVPVSLADLAVPSSPN